MKSAARAVALEVLGWTLLVAGIAMIALPGPGLLGIFGGLAILSQRYEWAERRLDPVKYRALKGAAESVETVPRILLSAVGVIFLLAVAVLFYVSPDQPGWWPLPDWAWLPGGQATSITMVLSALIAVALLVYSYRRFHGNPEAVAELEGDIADADREYKAG